MFCKGYYVIVVKFGLDQFDIYMLNIHIFCDMVKFDTSLSHTTPSTTVLYSTFDDGFSILTNSTYNSNYINLLWQCNEVCTYDS